MVEESADRSEKLVAILPGGTSLISIPLGATFFSSKDTSVMIARYGEYGPR
jgi:hypothetical protein